MGIISLSIVRKGHIVESKEIDGRREVAKIQTSGENKSTRPPPLLDQRMTVVIGGE